MPNKVPDFSSAVRDAENKFWEAAKATPSDQELPLYKDKPYGVDFKAYRYNPDTEWFDYLPNYELHQVKAHA